MGRGVIALYTPDSRYANAFMDYSLRHEDSRITVKSYTNAESMEYAINNEEFDLLLVDGLYIDEPVVECECPKVILSHKKYVPNTGIPAIFLYQKAELVFKQIYELLAQESVEEQYSCAATSSMPEFIGVFSPCFPLEREQFARALASHMARDSRNKVLYMNLAGLTEYDAGDDDGITELLLFIQQADKSITYKLPALVRREDNYDFLPGVKHYQDINGIQTGDIERLMWQFERVDTYNLVIVDIGMCGESAYDILKYCKKVWMPVNSKLGYGRHNHFKHDISLEKKDVIWEHITETVIPEGWYTRKDIREKWIKSLIH